LNNATPFKWRHFEAEIVLLCVRWYLRYALSYRDLEEIMVERGLSVDHTTIYCWVQRYAPELEKRCRPHLKGTTDSWRVDETYVKVKGVWVYLYRAVDSRGNTLEFLLSLSFPRFERVPKAEIYSIKLGKGIKLGKMQKVYSKEFKEETVRLTETSGKSIAQIARELGISDSAIHNWRKELAKHGEEAFPGKGHQTTLEEENQRLKRELERVQQERDILKKVVSIFSQDQR
jgi:transposase-like protein